MTLAGGGLVCRVVHGPVIGQCVGLGWSLVAVGAGLGAVLWGGCWLGGCEWLGWVGCEWLGWLVVMIGGGGNDRDAGITGLWGCGITGIGITGLQSFLGQRQNWFDGEEAN